MIPKNLDRLPLLRRLFDRWYRVVAGLDAALLRAPVFSLLSGTWEIVAQNTGPRSVPASETHAAEGELITAR